MSAVRPACDQPRGQRRRDERSSAETRYGYAGNHSAPIGKPSHECRNRDDIAKPETDAAHQAVRAVHPPESAVGKTGEENADAVESSRCHGDRARTNASHPQSTGERSKAQDEDGDRKRERYLGIVQPNACVSGIRKTLQA